MKEGNTFIGFDALKQTVSMTQVLERYGLMEQLHRSGDSLSGACPIHGGHNKTQFRVSMARNCWICFGDCHGGGSIIDFVSRKEGIGIKDAGLLIQDWFGIQPNSGNSASREKVNGRAFAPQEFTENGVNPPLRFSLNHLDQKHPYLAQRGLSRETIENFGLGYCSAGSLTGWIAIPIHNGAGKLVAYAGRWPGKPPDGVPKYKLPKGFRKSLELFNLHRAQLANGSKPLAVVEGYFGCMKIWQAGHHRVVSTMGSMVSEAQVELIAKAAGPNGRVILMFDEDEAGRKGRIDARDRLSQVLKVNVVSFAQQGVQPDKLDDKTILELLA